MTVSQDHVALGANTGGVYCFHKQDFSYIRILSNQVRACVCLCVHVVDMYGVGVPCLSLRLSLSLLHNESYIGSTIIPFLNTHSLRVPIATRSAHSG